MNHYTNQEIKLLKKEYPEKGLKWCAKKLGKSKNSIRGKASKLRLKQNRSSKFFKDWQSRAGKSKIGKKRPDQSIVMKNLHKIGKLKQSKRQREETGVKVAKFFKENGHPKGMLGKKQTTSMKKKMSVTIKRLWANPNSRFNSKSYRQIKSNNQSQIMIKRIQNKGSVYARSHNGWYLISGKKFYFRSSWEVNYARYLEWLVSKKEIEKWEYEVDTFWFEKIKRGVRSYLPDFKVFNKNGSYEYHEVKGWMDGKSKTKIKRMAKYYPKVKLIIIGKDEYKSVAKYERMFPDAKKI